MEKVLDYLKKIENEGFEAFIVGGYVRDMILGITSNDVDIATNAKPKDICKIFNIKANDNIGSINIKCDNLNIDITTYRKEKNYYNHRPKKAYFINTLKKDLTRRDFTINSICLNSKGEIIDVLKGKKDLKAGKIKVIGNVNKKFSEDPLRMLRALRFSIIYDFKIEDNELIYILNNKHLFDTISFERRKREISKILISPNSLKGLSFIKMLGLEDVLGIKSFDNIVYVKDYIGMWAQLDFNPKYPFTKNERCRLNNIREIVSNKKVDEYIIFKYGYYDSLISAMILGIEKKVITQMYENMNIHSKVDLEISGKEIKEILHLDNSPLIKEIKNDVIFRILSKDLENNTDEIRKYIIKHWK